MSCDPAPGETPSIAPLAPAATLLLVLVWLLAACAASDIPEPGAETDHGSTTAWDASAEETPHETPPGPSEDPAEDAETTTHLSSASDPAQSAAPSNTPSEEETDPSANGEDPSTSGEESTPPAEPTCAPDCTGLTCGDDGCEGSCGDCDPAEDCQQGVCVPIPEQCGDGRISGEETCDPGPDGPVTGCLENCQVAPGWTCSGEPSRCTQRDLEEDGTLCSRPIEIDDPKFFARLSLSGQFNSYHPFYGECYRDGFPVSSFGPDLTFRVRVPSGSTLLARMRSNVMPVTLALSTDCGAEDPTDYVLNEACVDIDQVDTVGTWAEVRFVAEEDTTLFLVTGTPRSTGSGLFDLEITLE